MKRSFLLSLLAPVVLAGSLNAASDYLLEIDGIKGESTDTQRPGAIELESFSWGVTNIPSTTAGGGGGGAGKVSFSDIHCTVQVSKASPRLLVACASGNRIPRAVLYGRKSGGGQEYIVITLEDILVSSLGQSGKGGTLTLSSSSPPSESLSLNFTKITFNHTAEDGTVTTGTATRTPIQ